MVKAKPVKKTGWSERLDSLWGIVTLRSIRRNRWSKKVKRKPKAPEARSPTSPAKASAPSPSSSRGSSSGRYSKVLPDEDEDGSPAERKRKARRGGTSPAKALARPPSVVRITSGGDSNSGHTVVTRRRSKLPPAPPFPMKPPSPFEGTLHAIAPPAAAEPCACSLEGGVLRFRREGAKKAEVVELADMLDMQIEGSEPLSFALELLDKRHIFRADTKADLDRWVRRTSMRRHFPTRAAQLHAPCRPLRR